MTATDALHVRRDPMFSVYTIQYRYPTPPHDRDSSAHPNVSIWRLELYPDRRAIVVATLFFFGSLSLSLC